MDFLIELVKNVGLWELLAGIGLPDAVITVVVMAIGGLVLAFLPIAVVIFLIWGERKIVARMQDRIGPNASGPWVGPYALLQTFADAIKMLTKEDIIPTAADRGVFNVAPIIILSVAIFTWAVIPLGVGVSGADLNIGIFYILSLGSGGMIALLMAGWGSNNKYALLGALRAIAQLISYEVPQVLAVVTVVLVAGSLSMQEIITAQEQVPFIVALPITAVLFFLASLAEVGRLPFELAEADSEIVAGYFVEYSGMKFGQFYLSEFINAFALSVITATLFLGGWRGPGVDQLPILGSLYLLIKALAVVFIFFWLRGTMPRLRIDQLLGFNWKFLVPVALLNICTIALVGQVIPDGATPWVAGLWYLGANVILALIIAVIVTAAGRQARQRDAACRSARIEEKAHSA